jgi:hypothetical protein
MTTPASLQRSAMRCIMTDARTRRAINLLTRISFYREGSQGNISQPLPVPRASARGSKNDLSELPFHNAKLMGGDCCASDP